MELDLRVSLVVKIDLFLLVGEGVDALYGVLCFANREILRNYSVCKRHNILVVVKSEQCAGVTCGDLADAEHFERLVGKIEKSEHISHG